MEARRNVRLFITRQRIVPFFVLLTLACGGAAQTPAPRGGWLSAPDQIARGVEFFKSGDTSGLSDALTLSGRGVTVVEEKDLWDMPVLFLLLVALTGSEWLYRRARGLA